MKNSKAMFALSILIAVSACAKKEDRKSEQNAPVAEETKIQTKIEMPKVKYPAAIIFEGGKGDAFLDQDNSKHTPIWRLYVCLGKTTQLVNGQVVLDLAQLGTPAEQTFQDNDTKEKLFTERLNQVILDYAYTTELSDDPANNYGYAYGNANIEMKSKQNWELINVAQNQKYNHQEWNDMRFFNENIKNSLTHFGQTTFELNGERYYIFRSLARFTYSEHDNRASVIEACEKADKPSVLQLGSDITPIE